jgi:vacuolar-type H+-ATPase subunit C/Vma6
MSQLNLNLKQPLEYLVRQTEIKTWLTEETMSPLGRELMKIANEIEASDEQAFDEEDIEKELLRRKGGYAEDGK